MKVLWVEGHHSFAEKLAIAAEKTARARLPVDLVLAHNLMEAERRLRLERFDLVILDVVLPDSPDGDMTIARIANMGVHRIAICSDLGERDVIIKTASNCGCNISPTAIIKSDLPFNRFIQRAETFHAFLLSQMSDLKTDCQRAA
ncbi:MAG: response regulator [Henriciella sp.]|nr:response regulator receiver protein [Hyphomonadaceae bacterium]OUX94357.1 MAG: response regulator receiver protein [Hyphomonas sp. TMED17]CAI8420997.1 MAG: Uncharacterised protein [Hyphomonas sp. TMED17]